MATGNGRQAELRSIQPEDGLSLYELADKRAEFRNEDGSLGSGRRR